MVPDCRSDGIWCILTQWYYFVHIGIIIWLMRLRESIVVIIVVVAFRQPYLCLWCQCECDVLMCLSVHKIGVATVHERADKADSMKRL